MSDERPSPQAGELPARLGHILCLDDFERAASRHLPKPVFAYISGAVERNYSLRANAAAFDRYEFVPRMLVGTSARSTATTLFGKRWSAPFGMAPMGICALSAYRGDLVLTQAAARENVPMIMSGSSLIRLEEVVQANPDAWFQAYLPGDEPSMIALVERVKAAGYRTLVVTVDANIASNRENNIRAGFSTPLRPSLSLAWEGITHPRWLFGTFLKTIARHGLPHFENNYARRGAPILSQNVLRDFSDRGHMNWNHFRMIRRLWPGHLVIKGILDVRDARLAVDSGADGIIVSNHGGRQLDGTVPPLRVLPGIVQACPEVPVMIDSGFRRGTDVLKAVALGAKFVFVGRPFNYAASVAGEDGVRKAIGLLREEVSRNMAMLGVNGLSELDASYLLPAHPVS
ncbi:MAG: alpha-hydroxy-acid oxidizing protein [Mycobacteriaceae bacterium]|uniref:alpha-hydroxy acid oxidase n=1 Tax=Hydrogenophaga sp. TaxID=1904254 RepID=UPI001E059248|nr:alpha-hydroxy acid oxidase [Hydrogenophaga sp.]NBQ42476.1 alpha-hydroxy-acid oxidizing protein [Mycobacteriaceae bacterium]HMN94654.1 alpha-hydroxy acid oxidase [Hydrogenophaga sp.]HMP11542.1 alpha-hydroxy acid oxidase [Hydrogenophaga sp.]